MGPPRARRARSRGGPTRRRLPSRPPRPREPGGPPRADRRSRPGWPLLYRNASDVFLASNGHRRGDWILDAAVENQIDSVRGDGRIGQDQGPGELADAKVAYGFDTGS